MDVKHDLDGGTLLELLDTVRGKAEAILKFRHHDKIFAMDREAPGDRAGTESGLTAAVVLSRPRPPRCQVCRGAEAATAVGRRTVGPPR